MCLRYLRSEYSSYIVAKVSLGGWMVGMVEMVEMVEMVG